MKQLFLGILFTVFIPSESLAQSLEIMPGTKRVFVDVQWLKTLNEAGNWSVFSRSRATADYEENTNLFTGAYFNYTTKSGIGGSVVGRIATAGAGSDAGIHFFKAKESFMLFALASVSLQSDVSYSWFSILRITPKLNERWKLYTSLELFSNFNAEGHVTSVQRIRGGLEQSGYQMGVALNLSGIGNDYGITDTNPGIFIRKQF